MPIIYAFIFLKNFFFKINLSPFLNMPPTIQYIFLYVDRRPLVAEKLVDLESLIIFKFDLSYIICFLYFKPLNKFKDLNILYVGILNILDIL